MATSWGGYGPPAPLPGPPTPSDKPKKSQPRQLLSCTKCRERKVKCDRTKPCSACCARGHPKECEFIVGEGNDYSPIQQSYEIRKLRQENQQLKELLQVSQLRATGSGDDEGDSPDRKAPGAASRPLTVRQRRFKGSEKIDNLYFGTPGLANIVSDFASLQIGNHSLTHAMPKAREIYADDEENATFAFGVVPGRLRIDELVEILPPHEELHAYLLMFERRAKSCSFPHTPDEVTRNEIDRFLADKARLAEMHPDMLALIFATLATGMQMGQYDRSGGHWVKEDVVKSRQTSDAFLAASMQALRLASFMNRPTLLAIQTLTLMGPYLTNSGRFLDAWTLFGTTIRLAHSVGLHRNPTYLDPVPGLRECMLRRTLWWWILHMDQQYSVTLGRPLGVSGLGDCPPPEPLTTNPTVVRLGEFTDRFTILARQILGSDGLMSVVKIDEFTDKLIGLWDTMPAVLQFNESWLRQEKQLPDWPLEVISATLFTKVQSFLVLLNRQRIERTQSAIGSETSPTGSMPASRPLPARPSHPEQPQHPAPLRGRPLVINSSFHILQTFLFFYHRSPAALMSWTIGQQAFNACMILIIDAWETRNEQNMWLVEQTYTVFQELEQHDVHRLAGLAVHRISKGIIQINTRREEHERQAQALLRQSAHHQQRRPPALKIDTAPLTNWSGDTVMGNTGMYLLDDLGLQSWATQPPPFQPLSWQMAGSAHPSHSSTPIAPSPTIPVSQVSVAPFPVVPASYISTTIPSTNSAFSVGLQPRMPTPVRRTSAQQRHGYPQQIHDQTFTPINSNGTTPLPSPPFQTGLHQQNFHQHRRSSPMGQQPSFSRLRGPRHNNSSNNIASGSTGAGSQTHRLDRPPRSHRR